ncbi:unnamed protein product [Ectocarpus sp. 12 AP-2014]
MKPNPLHTTCDSSAHIPCLHLSSSTYSTYHIWHHDRHDRNHCFLYTMTADDPALCFTPLSHPAVCIPRHMYVRSNFSHGLYPLLSCINSMEEGSNWVVPFAAIQL